MTPTLSEKDVLSLQFWLMEADMKFALKEDKGLEETVTVTLTQKDVLLLQLCLELLNRDYTRGGALRFDIQSLRDKKWA